MTNSREVTLLLDVDGAEVPVTCVVTYDHEGADCFADGLMYVIRTDKNVDILELLTDEQMESIEYQFTTHSNPFGDEDGTDGDDE